MKISNKYPTKKVSKGSNSALNSMMSEGCISSLLAGHCTEEYIQTFRKISNRYSFCRDIRNKEDREDYSSYLELEFITNWDAPIRYSKGSDLADDIYRFNHIGFWRSVFSRRRKNFFRSLYKASRHHGTELLNNLEGMEAIIMEANNADP